MARLISLALCASLALGAGVQAASAAQVRADFFLASGPGGPVGSAIIRDSAEGARFEVDLHGLPPGQHGFHVHQNGSCAVIMKDSKIMPAGAAGGHLDPAMTGMHEGPQGMGHLGDLPALTVGADGSDHETLLAPRIKDVAALAGRSLIIHVGGDNYSDQPLPLGGGDGRLACAVVK